MSSERKPILLKDLLGFEVDTVHVPTPLPPAVIFGGRVYVRQESFVYVELRTFTVAETPASGIFKRMFVDGDS